MNNQPTESRPLPARHLWPLILLLVALLLATGLNPAALAQGDPTPTLTPDPAEVAAAPATCQEVTLPLLEAAANDCFNQGMNSLCYAHGPLAPTMWRESGYAPEDFAAPGDIVPLNAAQALRGSPLSPDGTTWGLSMARFLFGEIPPDPDDETGQPGGAPVQLISFGDVSVVEAGGYGSTPWRNITLLTLPPTESCPALPSGLLAQSTAHLPVQLRVNDILIDFNGTLLLQAPQSGVVTVSVIAGTVTVDTGVPAPTPTPVPADETAPLAVREVLDGRPVIGMGQGMRVIANEAPGVVLPFNRNAVLASPVRLLDDIVPVPYPNAVTPIGEVNIRTRPNTQAGIIAIATPGMQLGRLGQSEDGEWLHVALPNDGLTGWIFRELVINLIPLEETPGELPTYNETPALPIPLGPRSTYAVAMEGGIELREGPGQMFEPLWNLVVPGGTPLEIIARNQVGDWLLVRTVVDGEAYEAWAYRFAVVTEMIVDALPIPDVLPTPEVVTATSAPGSYGGAFPAPGPTFTPAIQFSFVNAFFAYDATACPPGREEGVNLYIPGPNGERNLLSWQIRTGGGSISEITTIAAEYTVQIEVIRYYADTGEMFIEPGIPFILVEGQTFYYPGCQGQPVLQNP